MNDSQTQNTNPPILSLSFIEYIRLNPERYISSMKHGILILFEQIMDHAVDESLDGSCKEIDIHLNNHLISIRDYGKGIPLQSLFKLLTLDLSGGIGCDDTSPRNPQFFRLPLVNALSEHFLFCSNRNGEFRKLIFKKGVLQYENYGTREHEKDGTFIELIPDKSIFPNQYFQPEIIKRKIEQLSSLNPVLTFHFNEKQ